jgi:phosphoesterase RecJ-like protein
MKTARLKTPQALAEIERILREHESFFLGTHVFPDGDNVVSMIAMKGILDQLGKKSYLYCETIVPRIYRWIEGAEHITMTLPDPSCSNFDVVIALDSSDCRRLGKKFQQWCSCKNHFTVNIDHHVTNTDYGDINWICEFYSATGEQIYEFAKYLKAEITIPMAIALYTAIATDSGRFSYSNTTEQTFRYAAELVELGANPNIIYRKVYGNRSLAALRLEKEALTTLEYLPEFKLALLYLTRDMFEKVQADIDEAEGIIEHIGLFGESIRNIIFFKQISTDEVKVSVRTKGEWDASKICLLFDGGGHPRAGGYSVFTSSITEAINVTINKIHEAAQRGELETINNW